MELLKKFDTELHHRVLNNGTNLFLFRRKGMPLYIRASFLTGSRFDSIPGTAHFLEHMLVTGTAKFPSKNLAAEYIQRVGGDFSASTDPSFLRLNVEIPVKEDVAIGLELLNEFINKPLFDPRTLEIERGAILNELRAKKSNPKEYIWDVSRRVAMQGTSMANSNLGTEESIQTISLDVLKEFYSKYIQAGRLTIIVSGDIEPDILVKQLESMPIASGECFEISGHLPIIKDKMTDIEVYPGLTQLQVFLVNRITIDTYKEYCGLATLMSILTSGRASRLMTKLRYENGLVYSVGGSMMNGGDWDLIRIQLSCDSLNLEKVKEIIWATFDDLRKNGIKASELVDAQSRVSKGSIRGMQTSAAWVGFHENRAAFNPEQILTIQDYIETVNNLTAEDIVAVINKYLIKSDFYTAICGDYH